MPWWVKVVGLPVWLAYAGGVVSGDIAADARLGVYEVAVAATGEEANLRRRTSA